MASSIWTVEDATDATRRRLDEQLNSLGGVRIDEERLIVDRSQVIGRGGYGTVYMGNLLDVSSGEFVKVAVKQLHSDDTQDLRVALRLAKEMKVWCQLRHANILPLLGFYLSETLDLALMVCPYESLGDVPKYLQANNVPFTKRLDLCLDALNGLKYLHEQGFCHGDIKPANMLVNRHEKAVLSDFGLVKATSLDRSMSTTSGPKGSFRYLSPEVFEGSTRSTTSDVWAIGCTILEIVADNKPYPYAVSESMIIHSAIVKKETPDQGITLPGTVDLWLVLRGCWRYDAASRATTDQCIANYYVMLASHYTPGILENAGGLPPYSDGPNSWQRVLQKYAEVEQAGSVAETLQVGRWRGAAKAAMQYWEGTNTDPATHLPKLAISLQALSVDIANLGRTQDGLHLQQETCSIFRTLTLQGMTENQTHLIDALCRLCKLAMQLPAPMDALQAITEALDIRCKESYAFQTVESLRDCLAQFDECVTKLELWEEGAAYLRNKISALRASVRGLDSGSGKPPLKSYKEIMALRQSLSKDGKKRLIKITGPSGGSSAPGALGGRDHDTKSKLGRSTIAWDTQSTTAAGSTLAGQTMVSAQQTRAVSTTAYGSTVNLGSVTGGTNNLVGDNNILEYAQIIAFSLYRRGVYLRKLERVDEAGEAFNEATQVYVKISTQQADQYHTYKQTLGRSGTSGQLSKRRSTTPSTTLPAPLPGVEIAAALYSLAKELFEIGHLLGSKIAIEESTRIYTFHVLPNPELYQELLERCRHLLDQVRAAIKETDKDLSALGLKLLARRKNSETGNSEATPSGSPHGSAQSSTRTPAQQLADLHQRLHPAYGLDPGNQTIPSMTRDWESGTAVTSPSPRSRTPSDDSRHGGEPSTLQRTSSNGRTLRQRRLQELDRERDRQLDTRFSGSRFGSDYSRYPRSENLQRNPRRASDPGVSTTQLSDPLDRFSGANRGRLPQVLDGHTVEGGVHPNLAGETPANLAPVERRTVSESQGFVPGSWSEESPDEFGGGENTGLTPARRAAQLRRLPVDIEGRHSNPAANLSAVSVSSGQAGRPTLAETSGRRSTRSGLRTPALMPDLDEHEELEDAIASSAQPTASLINVVPVSSSSAPRVAPSMTGRSAGSVPASRGPSVTLIRRRRSGVSGNRQESDMGRSASGFDKDLPALPSTDEWGVPVQLPPKRTAGRLRRFFGGSNDGGGSQGLLVRLHRWLTRL